MARYIIGIDEVGRGALAGPVVVAAVAMPANLKLISQISKPRTGKMRDSKKLTPKRREKWFKYLIRHPMLCYSIARVYPRQIEKMNISRAANLAALRALDRLASAYHLSPVTCRIFLDGGLYLGNKRGFTQNVRRSTQKIIPRMSALGPHWSARTIVRGDEKIRAVAAASIIAKVSRDRAMARLAKKEPRYGFEIHKGYGTKKHLAALRRFGLSEAHRKNFCHG